VLLLVEDEGPGVPAQLREQVFQPFCKGRNVADHAPGSGIGLALAAQFASLHAGRAWVQDRPGGGASFRVFLPDVQSLDASST
jgi:two-component system, OmpR family, sensor histidine kinase MtrB